MQWKSARMINSRNYEAERASDDNLENSDNWAEEIQH